MNFFFFFLNYLGVKFGAMRASRREVMECIGREYISKQNERESVCINSKYISHQKVIFNHS